MSSIIRNSLQQAKASGGLCKAFGVRLVTNPQVVQLARNAGFDSLFVDLEHSTLSLGDASALCSTALHLGLTPFVRVPYQCGDGMVQRVLDGGALGVVFPHIHSRADAEAAVKISKYPPHGHRSLTGQLPAFSLRPTPPTRLAAESNASLSSVGLMLETRAALNDVDAIASVPGVELLLVGSNDLAAELGKPGDFRGPEFRAALERVADACRRRGVVFGLAGIYDDEDLQRWARRELGAGYMLGQQDSGLLARSATEVVAALGKIE